MNTIQTMSKKLAVLAFILFASIKVFTQDAQYSQFYAYPVFMNPAFAGSHSGTYRVGAAYRSQWAQTLERPFTSFSIEGDFKIDIAPRKNNSDYVGAGIIFATDRVGISNFDLFQLAFVGAYHKLLSPKNNTYLSAGVIAGLHQRSVNYNGVTFQDQFNGGDAFNLPTNEILPSNSFAHSDFGIGLNFSTTPDQNLGFYLGGSYVHLTEPTISFFGLDQNVDVPIESGVLRRRISLHTAVSIPLTQLVTLLPRAIYNQQGQHASITFGTNFKVQIYEADASFFHLGVWGRSTKSLTTYQPTDATLMVGFETKGLMVGFSYDIYLREVSSNLGTGTFELTVSYVGSHDNSASICPTF